MSNLLKKDKGFTLIEIVLVMAIAGLILLIVFLAVQGAQKSRRDGARKQDAARYLAGVESCAANHGGQYSLCPAATSFSYFNPNTLPDGSTNAYTSADAGGANPPSISNFVTDVSGTGQCPGTGTHPATVKIGLEAGGNYCVGN